MYEIEIKIKDENGEEIATTRRVKGEDDLSEDIDCEFIRGSFWKLTRSDK